MKFSALMMTAFAACSAAACQTRPAVTDPCDVLVRMEPSPAAARYLVTNDRPFAEAVARHRGRFGKYRCK